MKKLLKKTNPEKVSKDRFSELKFVIENTESRIPNDALNMEFQGDDKIDAIESNKDAVRWKIYEFISRGLINENGNKTKQLNNFIGNFISSKNKNEINKIYEAVHFYGLKLKDFTNSIEDIFDIENPIKKDGKNLYEKTFGNFEEKSIKKGLFDLISNSILLPEQKKQADFNKEMNSILNRIENNLDKLSIKKGLVFDNLYNEDILTLLEILNTDELDFSGGFSLKGIIDYIYFNFSLKNSINESDFSIKIDCNKVGEKGITRNEVIDLMEEAGFKKTGTEGNYFIDSNRLIQVFANVENSYFNNEGGIFRENFYIDFYTKPNSQIDIETFLEESIVQLQNKVENFANKIYKEKNNFPEVQNFVRTGELIEMFSGEIEYEEDGENLGQKSLQGFGGPKEGGNKIKNSKGYLENENIKNKIEVILADKEKENLELIIDLFKYREHFENYGEDLPNGIIMYGPPGTGKTLCAKKIASESESTFLNINVTDIKDMYVGESEKKIKSIFDKAKEEAKKGKVVLFFDEADAIAEQRTETKTHNEGVISVILSEMDGIEKSGMKNIFVIFTTNRLEAIDRAVKDRFNYTLKLDLPNEEQRKEHFKLNMEIFQEKSKEELFDKENIDLKILVKKTTGKSGRFIKNLILNTKTKFSHNRLKNPTYRKINTEDILKEFEITEGKEKEVEKKMGFI